VGPVNACGGNERYIKSSGQETSSAETSWET
jgi:hypothetical protein